MRERTRFATFLWDFVDGKPVTNRFASRAEVPAETPLSRRLARALKAEGFRFCGPVTSYAYMQSVGLVNDHLVSCWRHEPCARLGQMFQAP